MNNDFIQIGAQQGWQCPICKKVNAPWVQQCPCSGRTQWGISSTNLSDGNHIPKIDLPTYYGDENE